MRTKVYRNSKLKCEVKLTRNHDELKTKIKRHKSVGYFEFNCWYIKVLNDFANYAKIEIQTWLRFDKGYLQLWKFSKGIYPKIIDEQPDNNVIPL